MGACVSGKGSRIVPPCEYLRTGSLCIAWLC
jgi:hypothetical protein